MGPVDGAVQLKLVVRLDVEQEVLVEANARDQMGAVGTLQGTPTVDVLPERERETHREDQGGGRPTVRTQGAGREILGRCRMVESLQSLCPQSRCAPWVSRGQLARIPEGPRRARPVKGWHTSSAGEDVRTLSPPPGFPPDAKHPTTRQYRHGLQPTRSAARRNHGTADTRLRNTGRRNRAAPQGERQAQSPVTLLLSQLGGPGLAVSAARGAASHS
ncbi:hypothetical protein chiPu_0028322 [Chiloscyllium punctatum]|uniref:Uncharacterized protein n=1 Tax=Chiloscyllium punctatum TaxID=137246 RepID=A0A401TMR0_CHIPU|nr:hypothetical protein [Chiloscyllium punctatum]